MKLGTIAAGSVLALAVAGLPALPASAGNVNQADFDFTGGEQTWQVPEDVCAVDILANGASGGDGVAGFDGAPVPERGRPALPQTPGGVGGSALGTLDVTPGETLSIYVGGQGEAGEFGVSGRVPVQSPGGWNGGGDGGDGLDASGAGGGGASDIRQGGNALEDRVLVAGGGGGSGAFSHQIEPDGEGAGARIPLSAGLGGDGGGDGVPDGENGEDALGGATGGKGATQTAGGAMGVGSPNGSDGTSGTGGAGGGGNTLATLGGGAGGGGGYFGGGGGAGGAKPAGAPVPRAAEWQGSGGGGGSSFGPDGTTYSLALAPGDGSILLGWEVEPGCDEEPTTTTTTLTPTTAAAAKAQALAPTFTG